MSDAPTWYDLLDVSRDASTDEIRTAWKTQIADLEPLLAGGVTPAGETR